MLSPSHPEENENSRREKFPSSPKKLSDGMDEKLMWVINIVRVNGTHTPRDKVQGGMQCCRERATPAEQRGP